MKHVILWGLVLVGLALALWFWYQPGPATKKVVDKPTKSVEIKENDTSWPVYTDGKG